MDLIFVKLHSQASRSIVSLFFVADMTFSSTQNVTNGVVTSDILIKGWRGKRGSFLMILIFLYYTFLQVFLLSLDILKDVQISAF